MEPDNHSVCETCGLLNEEGQHPLTTDCIKALRIAMFKQKQSAERIGLDISIHFLRALEELSIRPDVGFRYTIINPETGEQQQLPPQHVSGVFASLLKVYREQSDFKPDEQQRRVATHWAWVAGKIGGMLSQFMGKYEIEEDDRTEALALLEQTAVDSGEGPTVAELQEELNDERRLNVRMQSLLSQVDKQAFKTGTMTKREFIKEMDAILHPDRQEEGQPDPGDS